MNKTMLYNIYDKNVSLELTKNQEEANLITHSGTFHADDVVSTCLLLNLFDDIKLCRTNKVINNKAFVYDIGFGKFDHHSNDFDLKRDNGIKYASCGLIWKEYGKDIISKLGIKDIESFFMSVDKNLIMDIDRDDNGQKLDVEPSVKAQSIPNIVSNFNPNWDEEKNEDESFIDAVILCNTILNNIIDGMISKENAREIVEKKIDESTNHILFLDRYMPWKDIVLTSKNEKAKDILYAIFPSKRGGYNIVGVPEKIGSFDVKKPFIESWAGLEGEELRKISGVDTLNFCHKGLFICACDTLEDAIKVALISIEN